MGLRSDGTVVSVGDNTYGQCNVYGEKWSDIIAISAGDFHTVALRTDGTVVTTQTGDSADEIREKNLTEEDFEKLDQYYKQIEDNVKDKYISVV